MWYKIHNDQISFHIYAKPLAKRTALVKVDDQGLHISLHAKPVEGEANKELISFLSTLFKLPKSKIQLLRGETSKRKTVSVPMTESVHDFIKNAAQFAKSK